MIPHVVEAEYVGGYCIRVYFEDGSVKLVDLEPYAKRGGVFSLFADKEFFKKFFVDLNTLCWPNGADIAPERLFEIGREIAGVAASCAESKSEYLGNIKASEERRE